MKIYVAITYDVSFESFDKCKEEAQKLRCYQFLIDYGVKFDKYGLSGNFELEESDFFHFIQECFKRDFDFDIEHVREKKEHFDYDIIIRVCDEKVSDRDIWHKRSFESFTDDMSCSEKDDKEKEIVTKDLEEAIKDTNGSERHIMSHVKEDNGIFYTIRTTLSYPWPG